MNRLLKILVNTFFMFFGSKIKKVAPTILAVSAVIIGVWEWFLNNTIAEVLCGAWSGFSFFCNFADSQINSILIAIIGFIMLIVSKLDAEPAQLKIGNYETPLWMDLIMYGVAIIFVGWLVIQVPMLAVFMIITALVTITYLLLKPLI